MSALRYGVLISPAQNRRHWTGVAMTGDELFEFAAGKPGRRRDCGAYVPGQFVPTTVQHIKWVHADDSPCRHQVGERGTCGARPVPDGDPCTGLHRNKEGCVSRSMLTLDADQAESGLVQAVRALGVAALVHSTWSHLQDGKDLRYRVVIPMDSSCSYVDHWRIAEAVMRALGWDQFDHSCRQAERLMLRASTQDPAIFEKHVFEGPVLDAAEWLARADAEGIAGPAAGWSDRGAQHLTPEEAAAEPAAPWQVALARTAVLAAAERVRGAEEGTRRTTLWSGLTELYGYVLGGCLSVDEVNTAMTDAADEVGVGEWYRQQSEGAWVRARTDGPLRPLDGFDALDDDTDPDPDDAGSSDGGEVAPRRHATATEQQTLKRLGRAVLSRPRAEQQRMLVWAVRTARREGIPDDHIKRALTPVKTMIENRESSN